MLDLFISYLNFFIIGIKYIVRRIAFQPPNPKGYRIKKEVNETNELQGIRITRNENIEILFVIPQKPKNNDKNKKPKNKKEEEEYNRKNRKLEYRPAPNKYADYELVYMDSEDNTKIPAFIFKPHNSNIFDPYYIYNYDLNRYIIIYCHGNSGDIGTSFMECQLLSMNLHCDVLCFEYPGYGLSSDINNINEKRSYYNIRQAYHYVKEKLKYSPEKIIVYGFSLGTGIAFDLACDDQYPTGGVILQSAFLSIIRTIYNFKKTYYFDIFNSCDKAKRCNSNIFFIHGNKDTIVPYIHGRILAKLIPKKYFYGFYTVQGANHNDILKFARTEIYHQIHDFIIKLSSPKKPEGDYESCDLDMSSIKDVEIKNNYNTYEEIKNKSEYEKKLNIEINTINNNITSNDELNALDKDKDKNTIEYYNNNDFVSNKNNVYKQNNKLESKKEENKNEKENSSLFSRNNDDNIINNDNDSGDDQKYINSQDIKLNVDNCNINSKTNDINNIISKNVSTNYKNDFTIINNEEEKKNEENNEK